MVNRMQPRRRWPLPLVLSLAIAALDLACGGGDSSGTSPPTTVELVPAAIAAFTAATFTGTAGQPVFLRPSVKVTASNGDYVPGVAVTFAVTSGGGTITGAAQTTDASGVAAVGGWTLGLDPGINTLTATASGLGTVTFTATASAALPVVNVSPTAAATTRSGTVSFTATDGAGAASAVTWQVNGVTGGSVALGVVSAGGVYTAPAVIPADDSVVVSAVSTVDPAVQRSGVVFFITETTSKDYYVVVPRVLNASNPTGVRVLLVPPATATSVTFVPVAGTSVALTPIGAGVLTFTLQGGSALSGYVTGTMRNFVGRLDYRSAAGTQIKLTNLSVNVRDATMPDVAIMPLVPDAQRSPYVLNIRIDTVTIYPNAAIVSHALQLLGGDQFDFVAVIATVTTNNNRVHSGVRNDVSGIGRSIYNNSAGYGGTGRLRGTIAFPIDGLFDGAEQGMIHETGHSWINFATVDPVLGAGSPHWPPSTMAHGAMGFNIPGSNVGGNFPYALTPLGNGTVRINREPASDHFTPLDLYVMGLVPPDSVPDVYVLPAGFNVNAITDGMVSPATTYTINDYVTRMGARVPSSATAPRSFVTAVVVLSCGRLLSPAEMAFFDHASARAETLVPLQSMSGLVMVTASGFYLATGGRATLRTRLP